MYAIIAGGCLRNWRKLIPQNTVKYPQALSQLCRALSSANFSQEKPKAAVPPGQSACLLCTSCVLECSMFGFGICWNSMAGGF